MTDTNQDYDLTTVLRRIRRKAEIMRMGAKSGLHNATIATIAAADAEEIRTLADMALRKLEADT